MESLKSSVKPDAPVYIEQTPTPKHNRSFIYLLVGLLLILLGITSYFSYQYVLTVTKVKEDVKTAVNEDVDAGMVRPPIAPTKTDSIYNNKLVFTKIADPENSYINEVWMMNADGTQIEKTQFSNVSYVYKAPGNSKMLYSKYNSSNSDQVNIYDFETKQTSHMEIPVHPDSKASTYAYIGDSRYVAPDYSAVVVDIRYTIDCSMPHTDGGPCTPDPVAGYEDGQYLYNFKTNELIPLPIGDNSMSAWDVRNSALYYVSRDYSGSDPTLQKLNYSTKKTEIIKSLSGEFDMIYPLFNSNRYVVFRGDTGGEGVGSSTVSILDDSTKDEVFLDQGIWAEIQPFLTVSPDGGFAVYERTKWIDGRGYDSLYAIDLKTNKVTRLTADSNNTTYEAFGYWLDNDHFITGADTQPLSDTYNYSTPDNYIININVRTGEITKLTGNIVSSF